MTDGNFSDPDLGKNSQELAVGARRRRLGGGGDDPLQEVLQEMLQELKGGSQNYL